MLSLLPAPFSTLSFACGYVAGQQAARTKPIPPNITYCECSWSNFLWPQWSWLNCSSSQPTSRLKRLHGAAATWLKRYYTTRNCYLSLILFFKNPETIKNRRPTSHSWILHQQLRQSFEVVLIQHFVRHSADGWRTVVLTYPTVKMGCSLCVPACFPLSPAFILLCRWSASLVSVFVCLHLACFSNTSKSYFLLSLLWQSTLSPPWNKMKEFCQTLTQDGKLESIQPPGHHVVGVSNQ